MKISILCMSSQDPPPAFALNLYPYHECHLQNMLEMQIFISHLFWCRFDNYLGVVRSIDQEIIAIIKIL